MTPEEMRAKLGEYDVKIADELRTLGFTEEEIARQLDPNVPADVKKAERDQALHREVERQKRDPNSPLVQAALADLERQMPEIMRRLDADRARRKQRKILGAVAGVAALAAGVWYFALRDTRNACDKAIGSAADLDRLLGAPSLLEYRHDSEYGCTQTVSVRDDNDRRRMIELRIADDAIISELDPAKFKTVIPFEVITGSAKLYVASDEPTPSNQQIIDDALRRSATTRRGGDPIGEALAALPEDRHVATAKVGGRHLHISFDRRISTDAAQAYTAAAIKRAR